MLTLHIGNKNYSSWSMRPWVLMHRLGIAFDEQMHWLSTDGFQETLSRITPAARVPVLVDDGFAVWDSLAIAEYLAERYPQAGVWPDDPKARARARSVCAEMHAGFGALRTQLPMNIEARIGGVVPDEAARADIARIDALWCAAREQYAADGPYLFGRFSAADAFFAPVATRFVTYGTALSDAAADWVRTICADHAVRAWTAGALAEHRFLPASEPYRRAPEAPAA